MPNKAVSGAQYRLFRAAQAGTVKLPGMIAAKAGELIGHQSPKGLPERKKALKPKPVGPKRAMKKRDSDSDYD